MYSLKPFIRLIEWLKFGEFANYSAIDGINKSSARILALHSEDDPVVSYQNSVAACENRCINKKARFITYRNRGHNITLSSDARMYAQQLKAQPQLRLEAVDKIKLYELDSEIMKMILNFKTEPGEKNNNLKIDLQYVIMLLFKTQIERYNKYRQNVSAKG